MRLFDGTAPRGGQAADSDAGPLLAIYSGGGCGMCGASRSWGMLLAFGLVLAGLGCALFPSETNAASAAPYVGQKKLEQVAQDAEEAKLAGHNAWMLTSCAL